MKTLVRKENKIDYRVATMKKILDKLDVDFAKAAKDDEKKSSRRIKSL